jgi:hypothetical protein
VEVNRILAKKRGAARRQPADWIVQVSPNQLVAYNLAQARLNKGWTQEQAAAALEPFLGVRWSKASFSAAERSVDGERVRQFTADEIVAFARCFELPVTWFFLPPPTRVPEGFPVNIAVPDEPQWGITPAVMVDLVYGDGAAAGLMDIRVQNFFHDLEEDRMTKAQHTIASAAKARVRLVMSKAIGWLPTWQTQLRAMANHLEDWEYQVRRDYDTELDDADEPPTDDSVTPRRRRRGE